MIFNFYKKSNLKISKKTLVLNNEKIILEYIYNFFSINEDAKYNFYVKKMDELIKKEWGEFPKNFIQKRLGNSRITLLCWKNSQLVGFSTMSLKTICNKLVHYIEFSIIDKLYQNRSLFQKINFILIKDVLLNNLIFNRSFSIELMFISPNIKTISTLAKYVSFIYPNPFLYNQKTKSMPLADDLTWKMANELIRKSENPNRKIEREGCVLNDSYRNMPWLIYGIKKQLEVPMHHNDLFNEFAEKYLKYQERSGKEFIIRAKITLLDFLKYIFLNKMFTFP
jgi:hypothetical protein